MPAKIGQFTGLGKVSDLQGLGKIEDPRQHRAEELEPMEELPPLAEDIRSEEERELEGRIGREWAKVVQRLRDQDVVGSVPELMVYGWLERRGVPFEFQSSMFGGRQVRGGLVPDFVLNHLTEALAILRVQGEYWHERVEGEDRAAKVRLLGAYINGQPVAYVVDVWENDVYSRIDAAMEAALAGRELRQ